MELFTLGGIKLGSTVIQTLQDSELLSEIQEMLISGGGAADPTFVAIGQANPTIGFSTLSIKIALVACGMAGCTLASAELNFCRLENLATRKSGAYQFKGTVVGGFLFPVRLSVTKGQPATISYRGILLSADGSAAPIALSATGAVLTAEGVATGIYTLGPVSINGQALDNVEGFDIDFGITVEPTTPNGLVYPVNCSIMTRQPKITINTTDIINSLAFGIGGVVQAETDSTLTLSDVTEGGARGTAPITFTIDEGRHKFERIGASQGQKAKAGLVITPTSDAVADIIAITGIT